MKLKDFIYINSIPTGKTYNEKVLSYFNYPIDDLPEKEINRKVNNLTNIEIKEIKGNKLKIGKKWFYIERDITSATHGQFIEMETYLIDNSSFISNLNEVLAIYVRPRKWSWKKLRYVIEKWDPNKKERNSKSLLDMNVGIALGLNVFFYQNAHNSITNIKRFYLTKMTQQINQTIQSTK
jgi:hypothetical protein